MSSTQNAPSFVTKRLTFLTCVVAILAIWLVALPWLAKRPVVKNRIDWLDEQRIDPTAMFYTDLESMDAILTKIEGDS